VRRSAPFFAVVLVFLLHPPSLPARASAGARALIRGCRYSTQLAPRPLTPLSTDGPITSSQKGTDRYYLCNSRRESSGIKVFFLSTPLQTGNPPRQRRREYFDTDPGGSRTLAATERARPADEEWLFPGEDPEVVPGAYFSQLELIAVEPGLEPGELSIAVRIAPAWRGGGAPRFASGWGRGQGAGAPPDGWIRQGRKPISHGVKLAPCPAGESGPHRSA